MKHKAIVTVFSALAIFAIIGGISLLSPQAAEAAIFGKARVNQHINQHQRYQKHRIHNGFKQGTLNRQETRRLVAQQHRIRHVERHYRRDGNLSPAERMRLHKMQSNANRNIFRQKNDGQYRR